MARKDWYVFVAELERDVMDQALAERNPQRNTERPIVFIGYVGELPRNRYADNDFSSAGSPTLKNHGKKLLPLLEGANSFADGCNREWGALSSQLDKVKELREKGYTVYNKPLKRRRLLYVLELEPDILAAKRPNEEYTEEGFDSTNLPPVYVGETGKSRRERIEDHRSGRNTNVHPYVHELRMDLTEPTRKLTKLEALREEHQLAWSLGSQGYPVYGGH